MTKPADWKLKKLRKDDIFEHIEANQMVSKSFRTISASGLVIERLNDKLLIEVYDIDYQSLPQDLQSNIDPNITKFSGVKDRERLFCYQKPDLAAKVMLNSILLRILTLVSLKFRVW